MSESVSKRSKKGFPVLGILGVILLAAGALAVASDAYACKCACYYSTDCGSNQYCNYQGCTHQTVNGKLKDGLCKKRAAQTTTQLQQTAEVVDLWLRAYEIAGKRGGGRPDQDLVARAENFPVSPEQHAAARELAFFVIEKALGSTDFPDSMHANPGRFTEPIVISELPCDIEAEPIPVEPVPLPEVSDYGFVEGFDRTTADVYSLIREAVVGELKRPNSGVLAQKLALIGIAHPDYRTYGNCEYPRLNGDRFPFKNGLDCLSSELKRSIQAIVPSTPDRSPRGGFDAV